FIAEHTGTSAPPQFAVAVASGASDQAEDLQLLTVWMGQPTALPSAFETVSPRSARLTWDEAATEDLYVLQVTANANGKKLTGGLSRNLFPDKPNFDLTDWDALTPEGLTALATTANAIVNYGR